MGNHLETVNLSNHNLSAIFIGEESLVIECAQQFLQRGYTVVALVSEKAEAVAWATTRGIPTFPFDKNLPAALRSSRFDLLFSIANLKIIPAELLDLAQMGGINFHDGPLPAYAGLYTTSWAIYNREREHGITWHKIDAGIDTGDILIEKRFRLTPDETAFSLNVRCYEAGISSFGPLIDQLESGRLQGRSQAEPLTYFAKHQRPTAAATLDWTLPAEEIGALARALRFGTYPNPLAMPKLYIGSELLLVTELFMLPDQSLQAPGTILNFDRDGLRVSTSTTDILLTGFQTLTGETIRVPEVIVRSGLQESELFPSLSADEKELLDQLVKKTAGYEDVLLRQLATLSDPEIPYARKRLAAVSKADFVPQQLPTPLQAQSEDWLAAALGSYLLRITGQSRIDLSTGSVLTGGLPEPLSFYFDPWLPLRFLAKPTATQTLETNLRRVRRFREKGGMASDLLVRTPTVAALFENDAGVLPLTVGLDLSIDARDTDLAERPAGLSLHIELRSGLDRMVWHYDRSIFDADDIGRMQRQFETFALQLLRPDVAALPLSDLSLLDAAEEAQILTEWNRTAVDYRRDVCIHTLFEEQAFRTPEQIAVIYQGERLTYRELDERSNRLAHYLIERGVGPDRPIGLFMERSLDMLVALFGILKAGGAYLPLDPTYPADRLAFMVEDTATEVILTDHHLVPALPPHQAHVVALDRDWDEIASRPSTWPESGVVPHHLSYLIYTSGSTGKPKGVMVEHRNAVNFFVGMDERIPHQTGDIWLAVTSLSFDISVLELFWTLSRGLTVVLYANRLQRAPQVSHAAASSQSKIDFGLFYFSSDAAEPGLQGGKYKLLMEGAKFADQNGFSSVWTPERHFHAFGGLYPNPAVTGAAVAAVTERVRIMAGSCVLPLHSPIRVAEEWAVVDNLSNGRVGISVAAGWQPNDFVLQPENFGNHKTLMFEQIETVKGLWRGESRTFAGPDGDVTLTTLPRPVQAELPIWITAAGNPETFRMAGEGGFYMLTHLLGQTVEEVGEKIAIYRDAWVKSGHPGQGHVSLMLHTFIGDDPDRVRETVRGPLIEYLRSSVFLIKQASWSFPTFQQRASETGKSPLDLFEEQELTSEEMEALLEHAFNRYYAESGLLGTPEKCREMIGRLQQIGVDEIACQIDFGVPADQVLTHLDALNQIRAEFAQPVNRDGLHPAACAPAKEADASAESLSIPALIKRYGVTHFQCTPSMMRMLLIDPEMKGALGHLQVCMLGGEALPQALAGEVLDGLAGSGRLINMYGPTETTIWSTTEAVHTIDRPITVGRPIANTTLYIVDEALRPTPVGIPGELLIGGDGVVRGYFNRPELTAERFIDDPFERSERDGQPRRLYRTGDLASYRADGTVDFLGRLDFQVKIRGYRIELGEIEALLNKHPQVREAVITAPVDASGSKSLVAYLLTKEGFKEGDQLRSYLKERLPAFMVPSHFIFMEHFPLTPNKKTDRKALPAPQIALMKADPISETSNGLTPEPLHRREDGRERNDTVKQDRPRRPQNDLEREIALIWQELLQIPEVGVNENFFEIGGHSILAVQLHRQLTKKMAVKLSVADIFRYATIGRLAQYLGDSQAVAEAAQQMSMNRVEARRNALNRPTRTRRRR